MEEILEIRGGKPLRGKLRVSGAKNEVTKLMVASALFSRPVTIENVPHIGDVEITANLIKNLGGSVHYNPAKRSLTVDMDHLSKHEAFFSSSRGNRLSILLAGPLLHRFGKAVVQKPGGCKIGERPLDLHLYYLRSLGINIDETDESITLSGSLRGGVVEFPYKSVGATEGALLSAVYAKGETIIKNPANEPEIIEMIKFLQRGGALIEIDVSGAYHVTGIDKPLTLSTPVTVIGDRVEAISYAVAAVVTHGEVEITGVNQQEIITALTILRRIGAKVEIDENKIVVGYCGDLLPLDVETDPHPALATDYQQLLTVLLSQAKGNSHIHETVHDNRFAFLESLNALGGNFKVSTRCSPFLTCRFSELHNHTAIIKGPMHFHGGETKITDLRAAFALVMAGLISEFPTKLTDVHHLLRGYDNPVEKLSALGADLKLTTR